LCREKLFFGWYFDSLKIDLFLHYYFNLKFFENTKEKKVFVRMSEVIIDSEAVHSKLAKITKSWNKVSLNSK